LFRAAVFASLSLLLMASSPPSGRAEPADEPPRAATSGDVLRILVSGVESAAGHVRLDVCTRHEFLKDCRYSASAPATAGVTVVTVKDLPPGIYAVQAYHDRNDNLSVDRNFLGVPTETVGFSNDPKIVLSPPTFRSAAFTYAGGPQTMGLRLRRFFP